MRRWKPDAIGYSRIAERTVTAACEISAWFTNFRLLAANIAIENSRNGTPPNAGSRVPSPYRRAQENP